VNLLNRAALPLRPSTAGRDNQRLAKGMRVPCGPRSRLKCDAGTSNKRRVGCLKERVNADRAGKPVCGTFAGWLRADAFDLHNHILGHQQRPLLCLRAALRQRRHERRYLSTLLLPVYVLGEVFSDQLEGALLAAADRRKSPAPRVNKKGA